MSNPMTRMEGMGFEPILPETAKRHDQRQRRSLRAGQTARRRPDGRRTGGQPGARPDGPAGTRPHLESHAKPALRSLPMRPFTFHPGPRLIAGEARQTGCRRCSRMAPACSSPTQDVRALGLADACCAALEPGGR